MRVSKEEIELIKREHDPMMRVSDDGQVFNLDVYETSKGKT